MDPQQEQPQQAMNGQNGNGNVNLLDVDDQDDIFVSTYDQPAKPAVKPIDEKLNEIDLNDNGLAENKNGPSSPAVDEKVQDSGDSVFSNIPISLIQPALNAPEPELNSSLVDDKPSPASPPPTPVLSPTVTPSFSQTFETPEPSMQSKASEPASNDSSSSIQVTVGPAHKKGEGISSFMVYSVTTKTTLPFFRKQSVTVDRRFSDFLGLYDKLQEKHAQMGRIVPPPPSKSMVGTAKAKFSKQQEEQQSASDEFLEKRRSALERFLQRNAEHPAIVADPDFREFLQTESDLPRSTSTSALSGAGVKRMFSFVSETVNKMTFKMDETDPWFESKQSWIENLDLQLKKLFTSVESLVHHRKEMTSASGQLAKSTAILGNCEEHNSLSCALSQLAATHEKIEKVFEKQSANDIQHMAELLKDYIAIIGSIREVFHIRVKCFQNLSTYDLQLNKKREAKARFELALRQDKVQPLEAEIRELEEKVEKAKGEFDTISKNIRDEFERFDVNRIKDFKKNFTAYLENLLETQETLVEIWEQFLPETKSITI